MKQSLPWPLPSISSPFIARLDISLDITYIYILIYMIWICLMIFPEPFRSASMSTFLAGVDAQLAIFALPRPHQRVDLRRPQRLWAQGPEDSDELLLSHHPAAIVEALEELQHFTRRHG